MSFYVPQLGTEINIQQRCGQVVLIALIQGRMYVDEQRTCVPCMVICALGMGKNGSPPGSQIEMDLLSACVLNTFICPREWLGDPFPRYVTTSRLVKS